jgi:hypothetical protein
MIDIDVIAELLRDPDVTRTPIVSAGEAHRMCRDLALGQIVALAARDVYSSYNFQSPSLRREDVDGRSENIAEALFERMSAARLSLPQIEKADWVDRFKSAMQGRQSELRLIWEDKWKETCDGKKLISDLHRAAALKMSIEAFKDRIVRRMRETRSENWLRAKDLLEGLLKE